MKDQKEKNLSLYIPLLILVSLNLITCMSNSQKPDETFKKIKKDTIIHTKELDSELQQEKDEGVPSLTQILNDLRDSYKDTTRIDTTFLLNGIDTVTVKVRHFCTYDHKIDVPARYLKMYNLSSFQTHDFISFLDFKINSNEVFKGFIKKEDFRNFLDEELRKYGVLLYPNLEVSKIGIALQYSISVPLSDVGKGFTIRIDTLGKKYITKD